VLDRALDRETYQMSGAVNPAAVSEELRIFEVPQG
jgi:hypothetical protein